MSAIAAGPDSPGTHASTTAAQCVDAHSSASGRPLTTSSTVGVPVATTASSSSCWRPRSVRSRRSRDSPVVASKVRPGPLADGDDRDLRRLACERDGLRDLVVRALPQARAAGVRDARCPEPVAQGAEDRRPRGDLVVGLDHVARREAERVRLVAELRERLDVGQVRVVAHDVARAVRDRADDRDPPAVRGQRQHAVVLEQHDRLADEPVAASACSSASSWSSIAVDGASTYGRSNSPSRNLSRRIALDREVDERLVDPPVGDRRHERCGDTRRTSAARCRCPRAAPSTPRCPGRRSAGAGRRASGPRCSPRRRSRRSPTRRAGSSSAARARRGTGARRPRSTRASCSRARRSRTAASNGSSCSSRISRGPRWTGAWLSPPSASPWPTRCLPVATTPVATSVVPACRGRRRRRARSRGTGPRRRSPRRGPSEGRA